MPAEICSRCALVLVRGWPSDAWVGRALVGGGDAAHKKAILAGAAKCLDWDTSRGARIGHGWFHGMDSSDAPSVDSRHLYLALAGAGFGERHAAAAGRTAHSFPAHAGKGVLNHPA